MGKENPYNPYLINLGNTGFSVSQQIINISQKLLVYGRIKKNFYISVMPLE